MKKKETFESALAKLQQAVIQLESGELTLDESLSCFEQGFQQAMRCRELLKEAEARVDLLLTDGRGGVHTEPCSIGPEES